METSAGSAPSGTKLFPLPVAGEFRPLPFGINSKESRLVLQTTQTIPGVEAHLPARCRSCLRILAIFRSAAPDELLLPLFFSFTLTCVLLCLFFSERANVKRKGEACFARSLFISDIVVRRTRRYVVKLGIHWRVKLSLVLLSRVFLADGYCSESHCPRASLNCLRVDVSRTWLLMDTILHCSRVVAFKIRNGFEMLRVLSYEQDNE